ncbi:MAG: hypothetical protein HGB05_02845 [Chloroflexi bacterium]|nr:hypothetical protein [Chloroflexota bacterium]
MKRIISVLGLGYVGLPVAVAFGNKNKTIGFDVNAERIRELREGHDRTGEVTSEELAETDLLFTDSLDELRKAETVVVVPHHILHYFPFAALVTGRDERPRDAHEMVQPHACKTMSSAA